MQDNNSKEMADISAADAEFAIEIKDRIWNALLCLRKFLIYSNLHNYYKEGNRTFIPLFFVAYHIFHKSARVELTRFPCNVGCRNTAFTAGDGK